MSQRNAVAWGFPVNAYDSAPTREHSRSHGGREESADKVISARSKGDTRSRRLAMPACQLESSCPVRWQKHFGCELRMCL